MRAGFKSQMQLLFLIAFFPLLTSAQTGDTFSQSYENSQTIDETLSYLKRLYYEYDIDIPELFKLVERNSHYQKSDLQNTLMIVSKRDMKKNRVR